MTVKNLERLYDYGFGPTRNSSRSAVEPTLALRSYWRVAQPVR
jgi:hypothetical protein